MMHMLVSTIMNMMLKKRNMYNIFHKVSPCIVHKVEFLWLSLIVDHHGKTQTQCIQWACPLTELCRHVTKSIIHVGNDIWPEVHVQQAVEGNITHTTVLILCLILR